jgi:predicted flap endonuclease-1-like 5' DNA nuclease
MWPVWAIVAAFGAGLVIWWQFFGAKNSPEAPGQSGRNAPAVRSTNTVPKAEANLGTGNADSKSSHKQPDATPAATPPAPASASAGASDLSEDDLTKIRGIGAVLKGKLNNLGIVSFRQIAEFTQEDITRIDTVLDFPGRIERDQWVDQAKTLLAR